MLKNIYFLIIVCLNFSFLYSKQYKRSCRHSSKALRCVDYIKNYDGDTITFHIPKLHSFFSEMQVRVLGVDTPEMRGSDQCEKIKAYKVQEVVEAKLRAARRIDLVNISRGKYFRIVADVQVDGESLSAFLLKNKLARPYDGGKKNLQSWCD